MVSILVIVMLVAQIFCPVAFGSVVYGPETFEDSGSGQATFERLFNVSDTSDLYQLFVRNNLGNTSNLSVLLNSGEALTGQDLLEGIIGKNVSLDLNNTLRFLVNSSLFSSYTAWIEDGSPGVRIISPTTDTVANGTILLAGYVQDLNNTYPVSLENTTGVGRVVPGPRDVTISLNGVVSVVEEADGYFSTSLNLSAVNNITVSFADATGTLRSASLLLDGDYLNQSEELALGFDPLCTDSDSSLTVTDESNNNVPDGLEYFIGNVNDSLPVFVKSRLGADPFRNDTDDDGLSDYYEVLNLIPFATPASGDTDNDGVPDGLEDFDNDTLSNLQELALGTRPLSQDSDGDGLNDGLEVSLGSNPLLKDSDSDGLLDDSEYRLGTNISNYDSDSDGIWDGIETYISIKTAGDLGVWLSTIGVGDVARNASITNESGYYYSHPARISRIVNVSVPGSTSTSINFNLDYDNLSAGGLPVDPSVMMIGYYNNSLGMYLPVDTTVEIFDGEEPECYTVSASVSAPGLYGCFNASNYSEVFRSIVENNFGTTNVSNSINVTLNGAVNITTFHRENGLSSLMTRSGSDEQAIMNMLDGGSTNTLSVLPAPRQLSQPSLPGYQYVKSHNITGSSNGAQTDYQMKLVVHRGNGTDNGQDVYLNGNSQSWPNDIRFTDNSFNLLSYWIESSDANTATVWVKVPSIPASPGSAGIFLYYGKSVDTSDSDGRATFRLFDEFSGSTLDTSLWNWAGPNGMPTISNGVCSVSCTGYNSSWIRTNANFNGNFAVEGRFKFTAVSSQSYVNTQLFNYADAAWRYDSGLRDIYIFSNGAVLGDTSAEPQSIGKWFRLKHWAYGTNQYMSLYDESTSTAYTTPHVTANAASGYPVYFCVSTHSGTSTINIDWIYIRSYTLNEPTHGTWTTATTPLQLPNPAPEIFNTDSDGDGIPDHVEEFGFRDSFGKMHYTNKSCNDTDTDGLHDGDEVVYVGYNGLNSGAYKMNSYPDTKYSDDDLLNDFDENEFGTNPLASDSDLDGLNDSEELTVGTNPWITDTDSDGRNDGREYWGTTDEYGSQYDTSDPLIYEKFYGTLEVANSLFWGALLGEWGSDSNIYYMVGWILSGLIALGDIRDLGATLNYHDGLGSLFNAIALIPVYGDAARTTVIVGKFVEKHLDEQELIASFVLKNFPSGDVTQEINQLRKLHGDDIINRLLYERHVPAEYVAIWGKTPRFTKQAFENVDRLMSKGVTIDQIDTVIHNSKKFEDVTDIGEDSVGHVKYLENGYKRMVNGYVLGGFGWGKIVGKHWDELVGTLGNDLTQDEMKSILFDVIKNGNKKVIVERGTIEYTLMVNRGVKSHGVKVIVSNIPSEEGIGFGNIINAHPCDL
jgi:hypothetical protein